MKTKININAELEHDDLVNLFSAALYDNPAFDCTYTNESKDKVYTTGDCYEDVIAKILLNGGVVYVADAYSETDEDVYGNNKRVYWDEFHGCMVYPITLQEVVAGLELASSKGEARKVMKLLNDDFTFDMIDANVLMQYICFGEVIY